HFRQKGFDFGPLSTAKVIAIDDLMETLAKAGLLRRCKQALSPKALDLASERCVFPGACMGKLAAQFIGRKIVEGLSLHDGRRSFGAADLLRQPLKALFIGRVIGEDVARILERAGAVATQAPPNLDAQTRLFGREAEDKEEPGRTGAW